MSATSIAWMRFKYGAASETGRHRSENQDRSVCNDDVFAVADGLGGYAGGARAAQIAVDVLRATRPIESHDHLSHLIGDVNKAIYETARTDPALTHMSTTMCVVADLGASEDGTVLAVANVGDSRLYALTGDGLQRITVDHTIAQKLVSEGVYTPEQARHHRDSHTLTRAVGFDPEVWVDRWEMRVSSGVRLMLCSDGVTNELSDPEIAAILQGAAAAGEAARRLVDEAVRPGHGRDNATAVVVDVLAGLAGGSADDPTVEPLDAICVGRAAPRTRGGRRGRGLTLAFWPFGAVDRLDHRVRGGPHGLQWAL